MKRLELGVMAKGGIGKSYSMALRAQYYTSIGLELGKDLQCFDCDQENQTFAQYPALQVQTFDILDEHRQMDSTKFDEMIVKIAEFDGVTIVDTGANTFTTLMGYILTNSIFDLLRENGVEVIVHTVIAGGDMAFDCLVGFDDIARAIDVPIVVWQNSHSGPLTLQGKPFEEVKQITDNASKIVGTVKLINPDAGFTKTIMRMNDSRLTWDEVKSSKEFNLVEKQRLKKVFENVFDQMSKIELA